MSGGVGGEQPGSPAAPYPDCGCAREDIRRGSTHATEEERSKQSAPLGKGSRVSCLWIASGTAPDVRLRLGSLELGRVLARLNVIESQILFLLNAPLKGPFVVE